MEQTFTSKNTSINSNKLPVLFSKASKLNVWTKDAINLDIGGGKFDNVSLFLSSEHKVTNLIYDPFNRSEEHNAAIITMAKGAKVDTVSLSNVLNVIDSESAQEDLIRLADECLKENGTLIVAVYEGDRTGVGRQTGRDQWQENRTIDSYLSMIKKYFPRITLKNKVIYASK